MSDQSQSVVCQRCGRGFIVTPNYHDFLERRGVKVRIPVSCMTCFMKDGPSPKQQGQVKWFSPRKRYGFIINGKGEEFFFHQQQLLDDQGPHPKEGQTVLFHKHYAPKGPEALNVELIPDREP